MSLIAILFACCSVAAVSGYATCGLGIWAGTSCVNLSQCPHYSRPMEQLHQNDAVQHGTFMANRVRPAMCGFDRDMPMICCPNLQPEIPLPPPVVPDKKPITCGSILWHKSLSPDGFPAELEEFSWLALLEYDGQSGKRFGCGGVLISDRHVLTAAHCLDPYSGNKLTGVRLGEHDLRTEQDCDYNPYTPYCNKPAIVVGVEKEMPHESYSFFWGASDFDRLSYDIAVIKLNRSVISDTVKPICLPDPLPNQSPNDVNRHIVDVVGKFISAGWGAAVDALYPRSLVKLMSRLKQVSKNYCNHKYGRTLHEDVICALSKSPKTACIADSGGPLMGFNRNSKMSVTGIYSPVDNQACRRHGVPSTFVDVRRYVDWIQLQMQR